MAYQSGDYSTFMRHAVLFEQAAPGDTPIPNTAEDYRQLIDGIFLTSGVVASPTALKVIPSVSPTLQVVISNGNIVLPSTVPTGGKYMARIISPLTISVPVPPVSGTRVHKIIAYATDKADNVPSGTPYYGWAIDVLVDGGSGLPATPTGAMALASVTRTAGVTTIDASAITDLRQVASTVGSVAVSTIVYSAVGTTPWLKPFGCKSVWVRVQAGGGGGGGAAGVSQAGGLASGQGGGGGGGGYAEEWYSATSLPASVSVIVGGGGSGGTVSGGAGTTGNAGGASTFTGFMSCGGGVGGLGSTASTGGTASRGGAGGSGGTTGTLKVAGGDGMTGRVIVGNATGGNGGGSVLGGDQQGPHSINLDGPAGQPYGGGGAGGQSTSANKLGGSGASGCVIVSCYF